jgi:hypothetical protein
MRHGFLALAFAAVLSAANVAHADEAHPWDATWAGGFEDGDGVQVIVAGDAVIGFFLGADYVDVVESNIAGDGSLTFQWEGGDATLTTAGGKHTLTTRQKGAVDRVVEVAEDH